MAITVLTLISTLANCGPVNVLEGIVRRLDRTKYLPVIATLSNEPKDSALGKFLEAGIEVRQLALSRVESMFRGAKRAARGGPGDACGRNSLPWISLDAAGGGRVARSASHRDTALRS